MLTDFLRDDNPARPHCLLTLPKTLLQHQKIGIGIDISTGLHSLNALCLRALFGPLAPTSPRLALFGDVVRDD